MLVPGVMLDDGAAPIRAGAAGTSARCARYREEIQPIPGGGNAPTSSRVDGFTTNWRPRSHPERAPPRARELLLDTVMQNSPSHGPVTLTRHRLRQSRCAQVLSAGSKFEWPGVQRTLQRRTAALGNAATLRATVYFREIGRDRGERVHLEQKFFRTAGPPLPPVSADAHTRSFAAGGGLKKTDPRVESRPSITSLGPPVVRTNRTPRCESRWTMPHCRPGFRDIARGAEH